MPLPDFSRFWGMTVHSGSINSRPLPPSISSHLHVAWLWSPWWRLTSCADGFLWCVMWKEPWRLTPRNSPTSMATMCLRSLPIKPSDCRVPAYSSLYASSRPFLLLFPLPGNKQKENTLSISGHPLPPVVSRSICHFNKMHSCRWLAGAHYTSIQLWRMNWASELNPTPAIESSMSLTISGPLRKKAHLILGFPRT